jgi:outer membrane protein assembly factor BamB
MQLAAIQNVKGDNVMGFLDSLFGKKNKKKQFLWTYETNGAVFSVCFSPDGSLILVGSGEGGVYALDRSGKCLWSYQTQTDNAIHRGRFSADGSLIAVNSGDQNVYLFNRLGELQWSYKTDGRYGAPSTAISTDGSLVVTGSFDPGRLYLFNRSGELLWDRKLGTRISSHYISLSADSSVIAASVDNLQGTTDATCLLSSSGELLWSHDTEGFGMTAMSLDGTLIATHDDSRIYLFNRAGETLWSHKIGIASMDICISPDGSFIVVGICVAPGGPWKVFAYDRSGQLLWSYETGARVVRQISISGNNSLIAAATHNSSGKAYLFDRSGDLLWSHRLEESVVSICLSSDGSLLAMGSMDRKVYLLDVEEILLTREP